MDAFTSFINKRVCAKTELIANGDMCVKSAKILKNLTPYHVVKTSENFRSCTIEAQLCQQNAELRALIENKLLKKTHAFVPAEWKMKLIYILLRQAYLFIINIISFGVRVWVTKEKKCEMYDRSECKVRNLKIVTDTPEHQLFITKYLIDQIKKGHMAGLFIERVEEILHEICFYSPLGTVLKDLTDFRMVEHLSDPRDKDLSLSVNAAISEEYKTMRFPTFLQVCRQMYSNLWCAKVDLSAAYRQVYVHKNDQSFLCKTWNNMFFYDCRIHFGLRPAAIFFSYIPRTFQHYLLSKFSDVFRGVNFSMKA